jgi:hypothetical protein
LAVSIVKKQRGPKRKKEIHKLQVRNRTGGGQAVTIRGSRLRDLDCELLRFKKKSGMEVAK